MACCPFFRMCMASLIHLVKRSGSLSITVAWDQLMTWFSWVAWSVKADLLCSVKLDARRLLVNVRPVLDSTSVLCSCNLTPNFLPVSPMYVLSQLAQGTVKSSFSCLSFGCTSVVWSHCHRHVVLSHYSCNGFRNVFHIKITIEVETSSFR